MSLANYSPAALWRSMFDVQQSRAAYLGRALILDLPVTFAVASLIYLVTGDTGPEFKGGPLTLLFVICVLAPLIETAIMIPIFGALRWFTRDEALLAALSTLIWALLHSAGHLLHGLGVFWGFFLFSICYLQWSKRSRRQAYCMTAALHALHNIGPGLVIAFAPEAAR